MSVVQVHEVVNCRGARTFDGGLGHLQICLLTPSPCTNIMPLTQAYYCKTSGVCEWDHDSVNVDVSNVLVTVYDKHRGRKIWRRSSQCAVDLGHESVASGPQGRMKWRPLRYWQVQMDGRDITHLKDLMALEALDWDVLNGPSPALSPPVGSCMDDFRHELLHTIKKQVFENPVVENRLDFIPYNWRQFMHMSKGALYQMLLYNAGIDEKSDTQRPIKKFNWFGHLLYAEQSYTVKENASAMFDALQVQCVHYP